MADERISSLSEVILAILSFYFLSCWLRHVIGRGYGWLSKSAMTAAAAVLIILNARRGKIDPPLPKRPSFSLKWSAAVAVAFLIPAFSVLAYSTVSGAASIDVLSLLIDAVWFYVFVGFAEELFFRGYAQGRLNKVFTKEHGKFLWVEFKWHQGTLVAAAIFGLVHLLNGVDPFAGVVRITVGLLIIAVMGIFVGLLWGVITEKTGDVAVATVFHGTIDFVAMSVGEVASPAVAGAAIGVGFFLFFSLCFERLLKAEI